MILIYLKNLIRMFQLICSKLMMKMSRQLKVEIFKKDAECHIDILGIHEDDNSHYICLKCCSRLLNSQKSKFRNIFFWQILS